MTPPDVIPRPQRRRRWRRRLVGLCVIVILFVAIFVLGVELVRRSDFPRRFLVCTLEQQTGLRVELASVDLGLGWSGGGAETIARGVVLRLPLDDTPIASVPLVRVQHPSLYGIIATGFSLDDVVLEQPTVLMTEDDRGRWGVARAIAMIIDANPSSGGAATPTPIPRIEITDGVLRLQRFGEDQVDFPLALVGVPEGSLVWKFDASINKGGVVLDGKVSTTTFEHSVNMNAADVESLAKYWSDDVPSPLQLTARWDGELTSEGVDGMLELQHLQAGAHHARGRLHVDVNDSGLILTPRVLSVESPMLLTGRATIIDGSVRLASEVVSVRHLQLEDGMNTAEVSGSWNMITRAGDLTADWQSANLPMSLEHGGRADVAVLIPRIGPRTVNATIESAGKLASRSWRATTIIAASGPAWRSMNASISTPELAITDGSVTTELAGLAAEVRSEYPTVSLTSLKLPGAAGARADVWFHTDTLQWKADVEIDKWMVPLATPREVDVRVQAFGDAECINFSSLTIQAPEGVAHANGTFDVTSEEPLRADVRFTAEVPASMLRDVPSPSSAAAGDSASSKSAAASSSITGELSVRGTVQPLRILGEGVVHVPELKAAEGVLPAMTLPVNAVATAQHIDGAIGAFDLLGGKWMVEAAYDVAADQATARVVGNAAELTRIAQLAVKDLLVAGRIDVDLNLSVPKLDLSRLEANGTWEVHDASASDWSAIRGTGRIEMRDRRFRFHEMQLVGGDARLSGGVSIDARQSNIVRLDIETQRWPFALKHSPLSFLLDSRLNLDLDLAEYTARGDASVRADISISGSPVADVAMSGTVEGRTVNASSLRAQVLGGALEGTGEFPLNDWTKSRASLVVTDVDFNRLASLWPEASVVTGVVSGSVTAGPVDDKRALEPLRIAVDLATRDGAIQGVNLGDISFVILAGTDRVLLDRSLIKVAGGAVSLWSRLSWHDGEPFVHVDVEAVDLQVNDLMKAATDEVQHTPGRVSARASLGGYLEHPHRAFGDAVLALREADLVPVEAFAQLYSVMRVDFSKPEPSGEGRVQLRLEGDALVISRAHYFNRGTDIIGAGRIENVWQGKASRVHGALAATARPLKESRLPFGRELDRMLFAALKDAATVRISGTIAEPTTAVVPFGEVAEVIQGAVIGRSAE